MKETIKKLLFVFLFDMLPAFVLATLVAGLLKVTSLPEEFPIFKVCGLTALIYVWVKTKSALMTIATEIFFKD